ncbi:hypothetical protein QNH48_01445 [Neobacillus sp. YX16]|uniref:hypothetical protein n=1 Tax=Neobacillus sp. YX16 TaxID=3047874 RepID=UPI0024C300E0|nr:hypothetical protein [Neobacillus sp. YX16]WHZ03390.1 hypothetical protein QNH48_01445 [Neobacillus sp. YX16]
MFFLDEKIMSAIPSISLCRSDGYIVGDNEEVLNIKKDTDDEKRKVQGPLQKEFNRWQRYFSAADEEMVGGFTRTYIYIKLEENRSLEGIANKFSKIKNIDQLIDFAFTYGNLGLTLEQKNIDIFEGLKKHLGTDYSVTYWDAFANVTPGFTYFEPIELWWYQIEKVRKVLKLYRALSRLNRGLSAEIEDTILRIREQAYNNRQNGYHIDWYDGTPTHVYVTDEESSDFIKIGRQVLRDSIQRYASKGLVIKASEIIETEKSALGFYVLEKKTTEYLITAIYYDLWKLINANMVVEICQNPKCQLPFIKVKRRKHCSDACKQEAYRIRKDDS